VLRPWHYSLVLDKDSPTSIHQQLTEHFRTMIEGGAWLGGSPLPSSRDIAQRLGINRKTASRVYEELSAQGLIYTQPKRGTFVSEALSFTAISGPYIDGTAIQEIDLHSSNIHQLIQKASLHHIRRVALHMHKLRPYDYDATGLMSLKHMLATLLAHERRFLASPDHIACGGGLTLQNALINSIAPENGLILADRTVNDAVVQSMQKHGITVIRLPEIPSRQVSAVIEQLEKYCINYPATALWCDTSTLLDADHSDAAHMLMTQKLSDYNLLLIDDQRTRLCVDYEAQPLSAKYVNSLMLGSLYGSYCDMFNICYIASNQNFSPDFLNALNEQQQDSSLLNMLAQSEMIKRGEYKKLLTAIHRFLQ
jgi:GntR family transcriptional regulator / MocR family aminotransferase